MVTIPTGVFGIYNDTARSMLTTLGVNCKLVYAKKIATANNVPNIKKNKSFSTRPSPDSFDRGNVDYKTTETTEDIVLRVYWDKKDFKKFGHMNLPDGSVMTMGLMSNFYKISTCNFLEVNTDHTAYETWRFERAAESIPHGMGSNKIFLMSFWKRV